MLWLAGQNKNEAGNKQSDIAPGSLYNFLFHKPTGGL